MKFMASSLGISFVSLGMQVLGYDLVHLVKTKSSYSDQFLRVQILGEKIIFFSIFIIDKSFWILNDVSLGNLFQSEMRVICN